MNVAKPWPTAVPCADCGDDEGPINHLRCEVRPTRISGAKFGFEPGAKLCHRCYDKHRKRALARANGTARSLRHARRNYTESVLNSA